jgi:hypothetical protein
MARDAQETLRRRARELEPAYDEAVRVCGNRESRYSGSAEWDRRRANAFETMAAIVRSSPTPEERATFTLGRLYEIAAAVLEPRRVVEEYERIHDSLARSNSPAPTDPTAL